MIQKGSYNILCSDGIKSVNGYIFTTQVGDEPMSFGIKQNDDGWYIITELYTGARMPFETNTNLMSTVLQLKAFLSKNSEKLKIEVKKTVERYGIANEVRNNAVKSMG